MATDSLGARRVSRLALDAVRRHDVRSVLVSDAEIVASRRWLRDRYRLAVEHATGAALAGVTAATGYRPAPDERVGVAPCGASTDPASLAQPRPGTSRCTRLVRPSTVDP